jgi:Flp pilus assembly protein TadG
MAGIGLVALAALVGGGLDMSRAYKAQTRLQAACDAGVLAGRKAVTTAGFNAAASNEAASFFNNNFNATEQDASGTTFTPVSPDNGVTVTGTASANVSTVIMKVFGFTSVPVSATCSASMGVGNSDVTMVLDTTGSMDERLESSGPKKIAMLRDAMKNFYDVVKASTAGGNARVRYAFVPYSSSINVGRLIAGVNPSFLVNSRTIQSREPVYEQVTTQQFDSWGPPVVTTGSASSAEAVVSQGDHSSTEYSSRNACNNARPSDTAWSSNGGTTTDTNVAINGQGKRVTTITTTQGQRRTAYTCVERQRGTGRNRVTYYVQYATTFERANYTYRYETQNPIYVPVTTSRFSHHLYKAVSYDTSSYKGFNPVTSTGIGDDGANVTSTWAGCIEERETTPAVSFNYNRVNGITPSSAIDLDIDTAPGSDDSTKWSPMWPEMAYYRTSWVRTGPGRGYWDLTDSAESENGGQAPSFCPQQSHLFRTLTETEFDTYTDSLFPAGNTYHDLGMLWGARVSSPQGIFANTVNIAPSNGGNVSRHLIFMTDGQMMPSVAIQSTYGIEHHDRRVTANGSNHHTARHTSRFEALCEAVKAKGIRLWVIAFSTGLSNSLENCASDNSAFTAEDADELNEAFQEIAKEVGELRITQ